MNKPFEHAESDHHNGAANHSESHRPLLHVLMEGRLVEPPKYVLEPTSNRHLEVEDSGLGLQPGNLAEKFEELRDTNIARSTRRRICQDLPPSIY